MTTQGPGVSAQQGGAIVPSLPLAFEGHRVRVITDEQGTPWFVAADVCTVLGMGNPTQALSRLDDDEKTLISNEGQGYQQAPAMNAVNEPGLYSLILGSRKPEAKRFKRWVTHEVLPAIRRTGHYGTAPQAAAGLTHQDVVRIVADTIQSVQPVQTNSSRGIPALESADSIQAAIVAVLAEAHANGLSHMRTKTLIEQVTQRFGGAEGSVCNALTKLQRGQVVVRRRIGQIALKQPEAAAVALTPFRPAAPGTFTGRLVLMDLIYRLAVAAGRAVTWADIRQQLTPEQTNAIGLRDAVDAMQALQAIEAGFVTTDNGIAFKAGKDIARLPWLMA